MLTLSSAFIAGVATFFASCLLPLVPIYIAYLTGISDVDSEDSDYSQVQRRVLAAGLFFVLGFSTVFILIGVLLQQFSIALIQYRSVTDRVAGIMLIVFGAHILGLLHSQLFGMERKVPVQNYFSHSLRLNSFLTGGAFAISWSPCIGPVLALALYLIAQTETFWYGLLTLISFSVGIGVPFMLVAGGYQWVLPVLKKMQHLQTGLTKLSGIILIVVGVLLFAGKFAAWSTMVIEFLQLTQLVS